MNNSICTPCPTNSNNSVGSTTITSCKCTAPYAGPNGGPCALLPTTPAPTTFPVTVFPTNAIGDSAYVSVTFRILNLDFNWYGTSTANEVLFDEVFREAMASLLQVDVGDIIIISVSSGSIIVTFDVLTTDPSATLSSINTIIQGGQSLTLSGLPSNAYTDPTQSVTVDPANSSASIVYAPTTAPFPLATVVGAAVGGGVGLILIVIAIVLSVQYYRKSNSKKQAFSKNPLGGSKERQAGMSVEMVE